MPHPRSPHCPLPIALPPLSVCSCPIVPGVEIIALVTVQCGKCERANGANDIVKLQFILCEFRFVYNLINCSLIKWLTVEKCSAQFWVSGRFRLEVLSVSCHGCNENLHYCILEEGAKMQLLMLKLLDRTWFWWC